MPRTQAAGMPALDVSTLDDRQLLDAAAIFEDLKQERLLPFNEAYHDEVRQELDRRLITELLRLDARVLEPLTLLRKKLCSEPSIHGGKKSSASRK